MTHTKNIDYSYKKNINWQYNIKIQCFFPFSKIRKWCRTLNLRRDLGCSVSLSWESRDGFPDPGCKEAGTGRWLGKDWGWESLLWRELKPDPLVEYQYSNQQKLDKIRLKEFFKYTVYILLVLKSIFFCLKEIWQGKSWEASWSARRCPWYFTQGKNCSFVVFNFEKILNVFSLCQWKELVLVFYNQKSESSKTICPSVLKISVVYIYRYW